jgi:Tol biopolymer transport system component
VSANGGNVEPVANFPSASDQFWVYFDLLPSGESAVVQLADEEGPKIFGFDLTTHETTPLVAGEFPRYADGRLFYVDREDRTLMSLPFDPERMVDEGDPVPVDTGILVDRLQDLWSFAVSQTGTLLYVTGSLPAMTAELVWVSRTGEVTPVDENWTFDPSSDNRGISLHPDGSRVLVSAKAEDGDDDLYVKYLGSATTLVLTTGSASDVRPRWMPDGDSVSYISNADNYSRFGVLSRSTTTPGDSTVVLRHDGDLYEAIYSPDGEYAVVRTGIGPGSQRRDILGFKLGTDTVVQVTQTQDNESAVGFSPDGHFLVFESDESGPTEVYVESFPDVSGEPVPVSAGWGVMPLWSRDGDEIFFIDDQRRMNVATVETDPAFAVRNRTVLFTLPDDILFREREWYTLYDYSPDDDRFLMIRVRDPEDPEIELTLKEHWSPD